MDTEHRTFIDWLLRRPRRLRSDLTPHSVVVSNCEGEAFTVDSETPLFAMVEVEPGVFVNAEPITIAEGYSGEIKTFDFYNGHHERMNPFPTELAVPLHVEPSSSVRLLKGSAILRIDPTDQEN